MAHTATTYGRAKPEQLVSLGDLLRQRRIELGITQTELGNRLGYAQERISLLERGRYGLPSLPALARIAEALDLDLPKLLDACGYTVTRGDVDASAPAIRHHEGENPLYDLRERNTLLASQVERTQQQLAALEQQVAAVDLLRESMKRRRENLGRLTELCRQSAQQAR